MQISHLRMDDRLIHGQITTAWVHKLQAHHILIADDEVAQDELQKSFLSAAAPSNITISIFSVDEAIQHIEAGEFENGNVFMLVKSPADVLRIIEGGVIPDEINLGNKARKIDSTSVNNSVHLSKVDIDVFKELKKRNIEISVQMVPTDSKKNLYSLLKI